MGHEPKQCLLLQLLPIKGGVGQGKEWGPARKFPVLKLLRTRYMEGTLRVEGGAEVSGLISGTGWGGVLGATMMVEACP